MAEAQEEFELLSQLVKGLPELQTDGALVIAQNSLDTIRENIKTF